MELKFNIYLTLLNPVFANSFASKWKPTTIERDGATLFIWSNLDWMACHLDFAQLEAALDMLPRNAYHMLCYGDAYDEAGECGELNPFNVTLLRSVQYANF